MIAFFRLAPVPATVPATPQPIVGDEVTVRLAHLFRLSTRAGRIHPLQDLLQRYRAEEKTA